MQSTVVPTFLMCREESLMTIYLSTQSPTAGFQPKGWPFGLQRRSRLGTFEPAKSMEVSALGNPCETAEPLQDSGPMGGRLVCRANLV